MSVVSIQKFSLTLASGTASTSTALAGGTVDANCVPFVSAWISTVSATPEDFETMRVDCYISSGSVYVATGVATGRVVECEVTVVEFDGTDVVVDSGTFSMTGTGISASAAPTVGTTTSFAVHHYLVSGDPIDRHTTNNVRCILTSNALSFEREDTGYSGDISGHWFTARATTGYFSTQQVDYDLTGVTGSATISTVTQGKSFVVGGWIGGSADDNESNVMTVQLASGGGTVDFERNYAGNSLSYAGAVVTFSGNETCYHGIGTALSTAASHVLSIGGTVAVADSMVISGGTGTSQHCGRFESWDSDDVPDAMIAWTVSSTTQVTAEKSTNGSENGYDLAFQVVEWDTGAAPPATRRVMVIT